MLTTFQKILFALLLFLTPFAYGQSKVYHEVFTKSDGLAIDNIQDLIQDESGFLWICGINYDNREIVATTKPISLQRFDGGNFHNIELNDANGLIGVSKMARFDDSSLFLHSKNHEEELYLFNTESCRLDSLLSKSLNPVSDVKQIDGNNYLLQVAGNVLEVHMLNADGRWEKLFSVDHDVSVFDLDRNTTFKKLNSYFIISDNNFPIVILDLNGNVVKRFPVAGFNRSRNLLSDKLWIEEAFIHNDQLFAFFDGKDELFLFDEQKLDFIPLNISIFNGKTALKTFVDEKGQAIIAYVKDDIIQLVRLDQEHKLVPIFSHPIEQATTIQIWSHDILNELWLGINSELHYYKFPNNQFEKFLVDKQLRAIKEISKHQYLVTTESDGWFTYNHKDKSISPYKVYEKDSEVTLQSTRNLIIDGDSIWTHSGGNIVAVHKETHKSESYRHYPALCLEALNDSILVYGTKEYHLMSFNKNTKEHKSLLKTDTLTLNDIAIHKPWIVSATRKGILSYNTETKKSFLFKLEQGDNYFLVADYHDKYGFLLGSREGTIVKYNPSIQTYDELYKDDLKAGIATISPYREDLWINTFNGLVQYNPNSQQHQRYSVKDGLSHSEGNRYSAAYTSNGILLGSLLGMNHFVPDDLVAQQSRDSLSLLKIRRFEPKFNAFVDEYDKYAFAKAYTINLPVENKQLELEYSLTGLDVLRNESYEYRLDDSQWVSLGDKKKLQFLNLASGTYDLEIRARDFSGQVIGKSLLLKINSEEFFYKKWWFIALLAIVITTILGWFLRQEKLKQRMQVKFSQDLIQNQENERSRIAKELHDSVGQQLTLIKQRAQSQQLDGIAELTNSTLEEVRSISRNLYPVIIKQLGLTGAVEHLLLQVDEETDLFVSVMVDNVDDYFTKEQAVNIYRFIQECISNVLKHSQASTLEVSIERYAKKVEIGVRDNGKGFDAVKMQEQNSLGLKTLKERLRILDGDLTIESSSNKGTITTASIPL